MKGRIFYFSNLIQLPLQSNRPFSFLLFSTGTRETNHRAFAVGLGLLQMVLVTCQKLKCITVIPIIKLKTELQKILLEINRNKSWSLDPRHRAEKKQNKIWCFRTAWLLSNVVTGWLTLTSRTMLFITGTARGNKHDAYYLLVQKWFSDKLLGRVLLTLINNPAFRKRLSHLRNWGEQIIQASLRNDCMLMKNLEFYWSMLIEK